MRGKPIRVLNNALALALDGHSLVVATYAVGRELDDYLPEKFSKTARQIEIRRVPHRYQVDPHRIGLSFGKIASDWALYRLARRLLREHFFDAMIGHDADGMLLGLALKRRARIPIIYDMHGSLTELVRNIHHAPRPILAIAERIERHLYSEANLILANWAHLKSTIGDCYTDKVCLLGDRPPVTTTTDLSHPAGDDSWKRENDIKHLLIYVGNFAPYQRVDLLIDMMHILKRQQTEVTLCLIGPAPERLAARFGVDSSVDIRLLGPRHGNELARILAAADVALSPRVTVNYPPMKVISYLAGAVPIVATDTAAHRAMIDDGRTGLLVPPTPQAFAAAASRLLDNERLRTKMRDISREEGRGYTMDSLMAELRQALARLPRTTQAEIP